MVVWALIALVALVVVSVVGGIAYASGLGGRFHFGGNVDGDRHLSGQINPMAERTNEQAAFSTITVAEWM